MYKSAFYFSHDYYARMDGKMVKLAMKHGMAGIGVYWCIVEMLYEESGYMPREYERISFELRTDTNVVQDIVEESKLFEFDDENFWSKSVLARLQERCDKSEKARKSIQARWDRLRT